MGVLKEKQGEKKGTDPYLAITSLSSMIVSRVLPVAETTAPGLALLKS